MSERIGIVGLGMMGKHYLRHLREAGYAVYALASLTGFNRALSPTGGD